MDAARELPPDGETPEGWRGARALTRCCWPLVDGGARPRRRCCALAAELYDIIALPDRRRERRVLEERVWALVAHGRAQRAAARARRKVGFARRRSRALDRTAGIDGPSDMLLWVMLTAPDDEASPVCILSAARCVSRASRRRGARSGGSLKVTKIAAAADQPANVAVYLDVKDKLGRPIPGLLEKNFRVYEDGKLVTTSKAKRALLEPKLFDMRYVLLLVDLSGPIVDSEDMPELTNAIGAVRRSRRGDARDRGRRVRRQRRGGAVPGLRRHGGDEEGGRGAAQVPAAQPQHELERRRLPGAALAARQARRTRPRRRSRRSWWCSPIAASWRTA